MGKGPKKGDFLHSLETGGFDTRPDTALVLAQHLKDKYSYTNNDLASIINKSPTDKIPCSIFSRRLSSLETIVKYLRENRRLSLKEIAILLKRSSSTVWITYDHARKKKPKPFENINFKASIPIAVLAQPLFSPLESIVLYLRKDRRFSFNAVALMLHRSEHTIRTVWRRAMQKSVKDDVGSVTHE